MLYRLQAMQAVLPKDVKVVVVGGVDGYETMLPYWEVI